MTKKPTKKKIAKKRTAKKPAKKHRFTKRRARVSLYRGNVEEVRLVAIEPLANCEKKLNELLADGWTLLQHPYEGCPHYVLGK